jgi:uncharacterized protein (DUF4415 family)
VAKEAVDMRKPDYTQADLPAVMDYPELTEADVAEMRPFAEVLPALAAKPRRARGPQTSATKISTTIRLSPDVVGFFKSGGRGWQSRIDEALKEWVGARR